MSVLFLARHRKILGGLRRGKLFGTTENPGPPSTPVRRIVQVFEREKTADAFIAGSSLVAQTVSRSDGGWDFTDLFESRKYAVVSYDHTGVYDPVMKTNLAPTVEMV